jgi:phosphohistidine phosphatase
MRRQSRTSFADPMVSGGREPMSDQTIVLVHHAEAVGPDLDPEQPLSPRGRTQAEALAERVRAAGLVPDAIWHSGKLRARQTAERFLRVCNPLADFKTVRGLRPDDPASLMQHELDAESRGVLVVSHMPIVRDLVALLSPASAPFPLHGLVVLMRSRHEAPWKEMWRAAAP